MHRDSRLSSVAWQSFTISLTMVTSLKRGMSIFCQFLFGEIQILQKYHEDQPIKRVVKISKLIYQSLRGFPGARLGG